MEWELYWEGKRDTHGDGTHKEYGHPQRGDTHVVETYTEKWLHGKERGDIERGYIRSGNYMEKAIFATDLWSGRVEKAKYKRCDAKNNAQCIK